MSAIKTEYCCNGWLGEVGQCCRLHEMLNASDELTPYQAETLHKSALRREVQEQRAKWLTRAAMATSLLALVVSGFAVIAKLNAAKPMPTQSTQGETR